MNLPIAPIAAALLGTAAAVTLGVLPTGTIEAIVVHSGLPSVLSAAEPPLGLTARAAIAAGAGAGVAIFSWLTLFLLLGTRSIGLKSAAAPADGPVRLRRADAHPDAPARAPLLATRDLGTPFLEVTARRGEEPEAIPMSEPEPLDLGAMALELAAPVAPAPAPVPPAPAAPILQPVPAPRAYAPPAERPLPADLDQPLAAFDPNAIPDEPFPLPEAVTPLHRGPRPAVFDDSERFETFELTPPVRVVSPAPAPRERTAPPRDTEATVHALLDRLEKSVASRGTDTPAPPPSRLRESERGLEEALVTLRNLARRA
jgi:hypothetical protein